MFFQKRKSSNPIVNNYEEARDLLKRMGLDIIPRKSSAHRLKSCIVRSNDLAWTFSGDEDGLIIGRSMDAPSDWSMDDFLLWSIKKNFAVPIYVLQENKFYLMIHIPLEGGVVIQNIARLVKGFDGFLIDFMMHMNIDRSKLHPLE